MRFAPDASFTVDVARLKHRNPVSAYAGRPLVGEVRETWLRGVPVDDDAAPRTAAGERDLMGYHVPTGGLPPQTALTTDRSRFTEAYAVIPARTQSDITASHLPGWTRMRMWVLARPLSGFAETFSQYVVELRPGGGSSAPEVDPTAEAVLFVTSGTLALTVGEAAYELAPGGYAYLPPGVDLDAAQRDRGDRDVPLDPQEVRAGRRARRARGVRDQRARGGSRW